jgi:hypothetical protein
MSDQPQNPGQFNPSQSHAAHRSSGYADPSQPSGYPASGQPTGYPAPPPEWRANGVGVAALVVGIVAAVFSVIPLVGMVAFFLGPIAIVLGVIGFFLKYRKKGMAITGAILGVLSIIIAAIMTAAIGAGVKALDESINAEHTVEYVVTTTGPADITYWSGGGSSSEKITADWKKSITSKEFNIASLTVLADFSDPNASVSCDIIIDGKSAGKNTGSGAGAHATCSGNTWAK